MMKVDLFTYKPYTYNQTKTNQTNVFSRSRILAPLSCDQVSFGVDLNTKNIKHLHCPYCAREMVTDQEHDLFGENVPSLKGKEAISEIKRYTSRLKKDSIQANVANMLCKELEKDEQMTTSQAIKNLLDKSEEPIIKEQARIYTEILSLSDNLPDKYKQQIKEVVPPPDVDYLKSLPRDQHYIFKRKLLINNLSEVQQSYNKTGDQKYTKIFNKIITTADSLPKAKEDEQTFIVKYANRSDADLLRYMILPIKSTADHIYLNKDINRNHPCDLVAACMDCNTERGGTNFAEWMNSDPVHFNNFAYHLSELTDLYAATSNKKLKAYVSEVTMTAMRCLAEQNYIKLKFKKIQPHDKYKQK